MLLQSVGLDMSHWDSCFWYSFHLYACYLLYIDRIQLGSITLQSHDSKLVLHY